MKTKKNEKGKKTNNQNVIQAEQLMHEQKSYSREDAYKTLEIINGWIGNMDAKISFAIAFVGVLIGYIFSNGLPKAFGKVANVTKISELSGVEVLAAVIVTLLYLISFASICCLMVAVLARMKNTNGTASIFFFGTIGKMELENYKYKVNNITEKGIIADLEEQIHTNSRICTIKAKWYNKGIMFLILTVFLWFVCILNYKLEKKGYEKISVGIGVDDGRALMVKAGYSGSGINDVVWMGDVVNTACHLANKAGRNGREKVVITEQIYDNMNEGHKKLFSSYTDGNNTRYECDLIRKSMEGWYKENCK